MNKEKRHYYDLDEATITAHIRGYLGKKKQSCDPYINISKKKFKKDKTPWYLATMDELHESVVNELSKMKQILSEEDKISKHKTIDVSKSDIMQSKKEFERLAGAPGEESYIIKNALEMIRRAKDKSLPDEERAKYAKFYNYIRKNFGGDVYQFAIQQLKKVSNLTFGEIQKRNPQLAKQIYDYIVNINPKFRASGEKLTPSFNKWNFLDPEDEEGARLRQAVENMAMGGEVEFKTKKFIRPSSLKGQMRVRTSRRISKPLPKASPGEIAQSGDERAAASLEDIQAELEKEDPTVRPGTAFTDLKNIYKRIARDIIWGPKGEGGGYFPELLKSKAEKWRKRGVDLPKALEKLVRLQDKIPDALPSEDEPLDPILTQNFSEKELKALVDLSNSALPELAVNRLAPSGKYFKDIPYTLTQFEKALKPFVISAFKKDEKPSDEDLEKIRRGEYFKSEFDEFDKNEDVSDIEDTGLATFEALETYARYTTNGDLEKAREQLINLRKRNPKEYRKEKAKIIQKLRDEGKHLVAQHERDQDIARLAVSSDLPKLIKSDDPVYDLEKYLYGHTEENELEDEKEERPLDRDELFMKLMAKRAAKAKHRRRAKMAGLYDLYRSEEKPEPKIYYGSERSKQRHLKGPDFTPLKQFVKQQREKEDDPLQALRRVAKRARIAKPRPKAPPPDLSYISVEPGSRREKISKKRVSPSFSKKTSVLPKDLTWGDLPPHVQRTLLKRFGKKRKSISPNWKRFEVFPKSIQKWIAKKINEDYQNIKLEMLFNIDGTECKEKPKSKKWESAPLANKMKFEPEKV